MKRALGIFERSQWLTDELYTFNAIGVLCLDGAPSPETLQRALAILQERRPMLRCHLTSIRGKPWFEPGAPPVPLEVIHRERDDQWQEVVEEELVRRVDSGNGPLLRCRYLVSEPPGGRAEIVLTLHHVAIDGDSGIRLCDELLRLCAGEQLDDTSPPTLLTPPTEQLMPAAYQGLARYWRCLRFTLRQMADEMGYQLRTRRRRQPVIDLETRGRVLTAGLSVAETTALTRRARRERVSVNSVISATMLLAVQRHLYKGDARPYRYFTMARLRPYLQPAQDPQSLGSHFAMLRFTIGLAENEDLWLLARRINEQVYSAARRGEKYTSLLMSGVMVPLMFRLKTGRMATTAFSYAGAPRLTESYGPIQLRDLHVCVSNFGLGPEYTAQVRLWRGRLCWDIVYLECDMDRATAQVIADDMLERLRAGTE